MTTDLYAIGKEYIDRMLSADNVAGGRAIRVLLLDNSTAPIISLITTQSDLLKREIYLVDRLENDNRDQLRSLDCICFLKPSDYTITKLCDEIGHPRYSNYKIYFNDSISKSRLERLAESDDLEVVTSVIEIFQDYFTLNKRLYSATNIINPYSPQALQTWDQPSLESSAESILTLLLATNNKPGVIKYESNSKMAAKLANSVNYEITSNSQLFGQIEQPSSSQPLVLIMDRKNDPVTPLLFPWTYQSMINELLEISNANNTVDLSHLSNVSEELRTVVMNETQDQFYSKTMYMNFGDLSSKLKEYVDEYKHKTKTNSNISSIKDMKFFLENYPEYKKMSLNLSKHILLSSEIDKQIKIQRIWETSEFEQNMCHTADTSNHEEDVQQLHNFLFDSKNADGIPNKPISELGKLKLLGLYSLKYENYTNNQISHTLEKLNNPIFTRFINILLKYGGLKSRMNGEDGNVFIKKGGSTGPTNHVTALFHNFSKNNTDNAYMQHQPRLVSILDRIIKGKFVSNNFASIGGSSGEQQFRNIIVFMIGGICYEEVRHIDELNKTNDVNIIIGGTHTLNSKRFIGNLQDAGELW
ncbi:hypothetical protein CANINC_005064 [Pichia inconspicua]|uniref:Vacuolar protein sorting-associated protein 45 n=1 Tax=Pichia inconspicua TaxID=52247 RepID=A0A4T0WUD4_9ASCO|nr:hypothetical protein CANINC_005064 [[Candida] inconspicua]